MKVAGPLGRLSFCLLLAEATESDYASLAVGAASRIRDSAQVSCRRMAVVQALAEEPVRKVAQSRSRDAALSV